MNCIYCCVFNQQICLDLFFLLLESILTYGNLKDDTHILVYTSTSFKNSIKENHLFDNTKIHFEVNDTYDSIDKACKSRLDIFQFDCIKKYNKILYLDIDIIIKDDIHKVFDICKEDVLYALEEGTIDEGDVYGGETLFGKEIEKYEDKSAFSSGIMLFNNCEIIRFLFDKIKEDMVERPCDFPTRDQPYIVYNTFKYKLVENKTLKSFAVNNEFNVYSDKVIHHFPGGVGIFPHKRHIMSYFLNNLNEYTAQVKEEVDIFDCTEWCVLPVLNICFWLWSVLLILFFAFGFIYFLLYLEIKPHSFL